VFAILRSRNWVRLTQSDSVGIDGRGKPDASPPARGAGPVGAASRGGPPCHRELAWCVRCARYTRSPGRLELSRRPGLSGAVPLRLSRRAGRSPHQGFMPRHGPVRSGANRGKRPRGRPPRDPGPPRRVPPMRPRRYVTFPTPTPTPGGNRRAAVPLYVRPGFFSERPGDGGLPLLAHRHAVLPGDERRSRDEEDGVVYAKDVRPGRAVDRVRRSVIVLVDDAELAVGEVVDGTTRRSDAGPQGGLRWFR
jgi:hypothetical protein